MKSGHWCHWGDASVAGRSHSRKKLARLLLQGACEAGSAAFAEVLFPQFLPLAPLFRREYPGHPADGDFVTLCGW
jgi:hypothetical protein